MGIYISPYEDPDTEWEQKQYQKSVEKSLSLL